MGTCVPHTVQTARHPEELKDDDGQGCQEGSNDDARGLLDEVKTGIGSRGNKLVSQLRVGA